MLEAGMCVSKLTPRIGAEILDVDLADLSDTDVARIREIFLENLVVFFRDQTITTGEFVSFARRFGNVKLNYKPNTRVPGHPEVVTLTVDENTGRQPGDMWHSDGAADPEPPMASILYMQQLPGNGGGDTLFANTCAAYDSLSDDMKRFLDGLTAVNDRAHSLRTQTGGLSLQPGEPAPVSEHPVIRVHPETGRKGLFVNPTYTTRIVQLDPLQSDALLASLFELIESPLYQCRFKWGPGSIAFWDNRCAQHYAVWDYFPHRRIAHRITLAGDRPFGVHCPPAVAG